MSLLMHMMGVIAGQTPAGFTTWNPSDKSANITLSGGNLTAATSGSTGGVRSTNSKGAVQAYFAITIVSGPGGTSQFIGMGTASYDESQNVGNEANSWGYNPVTGTIKNNNSTLTTVATSAIGDEIEMEYNGTANTLEWFKNGSSLYKATGISATMYIAWSSNGTGSATLNCGATSFAHASPHSFPNYG